MARLRKKQLRSSTRPVAKLQGIDRRREITEAALALFAERSFASVTIKGIAGKLRINPALIYYYFESKQDLFRASIESAIFNAVSHYDGIRSLHDDPAGLIDAWLESNVKLSHMISNLVKVMLDHSGLPRQIPSVDRLVKRFYEEECRILSGAIGRGIKIGVFQPVDERRLALFASSHLDGVMVAAKIRPGFDLAQAIEDLRNILFSNLGYEHGKSRRVGARADAGADTDAPV
jgi:TetR/AcrR family transcriptional regulator, upper aerobic nicotinate degradation pathway regulator